MGFFLLSAGQVRARSVSHCSGCLLSLESQQNVARVSKVGLVEQIHKAGDVVGLHQFCVQVFEKTVREVLLRSDLSVHVVEHLGRKRCNEFLEKAVKLLIVEQELVASDVHVVRFVSA